jgi:hypothetical protein
MASVLFSLFSLTHYLSFVHLWPFKVGMGAAAAGAMASLFDAGGVAGGVFAGVATDNLLGG